MAMKLTNAIRIRSLFLALLASAALASQAKEATALSLVSEGNRYIGEQAKDKLVELRSEKSLAGLEPNIWYVVYYDTTASMKAVEVKFGAGKMLEVKRPFRLLEYGRKDMPLDRAKIKIDSDEAIKTATAEPMLEKLKLTNTQLKLERTREGTIVWRVRLWAAKLRNPNATADVGDVYVSAEDGKVVRTDLHVNRVD
jgi:hypothetical protein